MFVTVVATIVFITLFLTNEPLRLWSQKSDAKITQA